MISVKNLSSVECRGGDGMESIHLGDSMQMGEAGAAKLSKGGKALMPTENPLRLVIASSEVRTQG